ncbi:hypothetical protein ACH3VR_08585 [Microbacterium sp. B2969]|uniref:Transcriptional regulator, AbiEi antitoxin, Type IV TA system n=1 Tax=Microbacterium alkaliflavum TaxID=3248839 RepID=A0ABW7Q6B7_9MICO
MLQTLPAIMPSPIALLRFADISHPERGVRRSELVRVRAGVYAAALEWEKLAPWERYLARVHAVALLRPDAVFSHESAAALLGLPIFGDPTVVHVLASPGTTARLIAGVRVHNWTGDRELIEVSGMLLTSVADTAVDLARSRHPAIGLSVADGALRLDPRLGVANFVANNEARSSKRGRAIARWPLSAATPLAATAVESVSRAVIEWLGFPPPELQVTLRASTVDEDRPDFLWPDLRVAGEADGDLKYDGRFGSPTDILKRQRVRDARLRTQLKAVAHWGWYEATTVDPLRTLLLGHGLRPIRPENPVPLFSLRRAVAPSAPHRVSPTASQP